MGIIRLILFVWIGTIPTQQATAAPCIYGNQTDCFYQCHCRDKSECGEVCTRGCDTSGITPEIQRTWTGSTCQIGNIALSKPTNQSTTYKTLYSSKAVDGMTGSGYQSCAHGGDTPQPHHWWLDLRGVFKIYNITLYNRNDCCQERLGFFKLGVVDDQNKETECARYDKSAVGVLVIPLTCPQPLIGRYVHFVQEKQAQGTAFCEIIVIGHKYTDCRNCPAECNDVTGCKECIGSYQPDCQIACDDGFYGANCVSRCQNCTRDVCDKITGNCESCKDGFHGAQCNKTCGHCSEGKCNQADGFCSECIIWWSGRTCQAEIVFPQLKNETIIEPRASNNSVTVTWELLTSVPDNLIQHYQYTIKYKLHTDLNYVTASVTKHKGVPRESSTIAGLHHNTIYDVIIIPQRVMREKEEANPDGNLYGPVSVKTECNVPDLSTLFFNATIRNSIKKENFPSIEISFPEVWDLDNGCDNIMNAYISFKADIQADFMVVPLLPEQTTFTVFPTTWGLYNLSLRIVNNENLSSVTSLNVDLVAPSADIQNLVLYIMAGLAVVVVVCVTAAIFTGVKYRFYKKKTTELQREICDIKAHPKQKYETYEMQESDSRYTVVTDQDGGMEESAATYEAI